MGLNDKQGFGGTGDGAEFTDPHRIRGSYQPVWVILDRLFHLNIKRFVVAREFKSFFSLGNRRQI
ncbi:hypothetical protein GCM10011391_07230 [Pullulanibacillus camelliae]|uniref:Uncharacterized protein n=1 Tax=Pullulanibacillus camelliae TaxID=1707096 RepID=A0A8J2YFY0_9BACL|nr:hypothetical protein GCM10011391_07230 [Pullulanibacillus camelliae]